MTNSNNTMVLGFHYTLKNAKGELLDQSDADAGPLYFMTGSGQIIPGLEQKLLTMKTGDKANLKLAAADAYGERDEALVQDIPREKFPKKDVEIGQVFEIQYSENDLRLVTVTNLTLENVTLDANHPLAGEELHFDVTLEEVREATEEEISHGHAHEPNGHHH